MSFNELIGSFADEVGLELTALDGAGALHLDFNGMTVSFFETGDASRLLLVGEIGRIPSSGAEIFCRVMLRSMFLDGMASGATFSLSPESDRAFLQRREPLSELDPVRFKSVVESFVNELEKWRTALASFRPAAEEIGKAKAAETAETREIENNGFMRV